jgi:hypothetical protein
MLSCARWDTCAGCREAAYDSSSIPQKGWCSTSATHSCVLAQRDIRAGWLGTPAPARSPRTRSISQHRGPQRYTSNPNPTGGTWDTGLVIHLTRPPLPGALRHGDIEGCHQSQGTALTDSSSRWWCGTTAGARQRRRGGAESCQWLERAHRPQPDPTPAVRARPRPHRVRNTRDQQRRRAAGASS